MAKKKKAPARKPSKPSRTELMQQMKQFVRSKGVDYLRDKNISSVGIGYKISKETKTKELAIQFTVERKAAMAELESLGTAPIPTSFTIGGVTVPTDVLQRKYEASFRVLPEGIGGPRKTRIDPIVPGVSVGNKRISAGTLGCIVYDRGNGASYMLSNWHVLHSPTGQIGDDIVQPGKHDDNRVEQNRVGTLVRSHLGVAGDCAVASIDDRAFDTKILDLATVVEKIGEPDLDDKVMKSGRTTAVTHGIVTRIHTITKIDYGAPVGEESVGGFEIGPDPDHPPVNGEISLGGDSGSVWLFKNAQGKPTNVMAGLHFAGEAPSDPNEHAVACYASSVFEKLEITLQPSPSLPQAVQPTGYDPNFLGSRVDVPKLTSAQKADAAKLGSSHVIPYTHFSLAQCKSRRFCYWVAWNVDGGRLRRLSRNGIPFILDPRLPNSVQVGNSLYANNRLDRGHVARRADLVWGTPSEAKKANIDSFFFTNITPQMDNFNQGNLGGIWGRLEDAVFEEVNVENLRISVFGGPVFHDDDRNFQGIKIPREFFKVIAFVESGNLKTRGFLLTQNLDQLELLDLDEFRVFQVALTEIEERCGFSFPDDLKDADSFAEQLEALAESTERKAIESLRQIRW